MNGAAIAALLVHVLNPHMALAKVTDDNFAADAGAELTLSETPTSRLFNPEVKLPVPDRRFRATITAYTSTADQTDSTPFIAASGKRVHDRMIAANGLPFGTIVKIPSLYGDKEFVVEDRMNARYTLGRMDIWLDATKAEARKFGVKRVDVEIYYPEAKQLAKK